MKDAEFYYPEGNILLVVGGGHEHETVFRVFMSQLSKHSDMFRDMLVIPQPVRVAQSDSKGTGGLEELPIVDMDDRVEDVRETFRLLWDIP